MHTGKEVFPLFNIGDKIAHPMHGAGVISDIEERRINGQSRKYYVVKIPVGGLVVMIPVDNCEEIGVRKIIGPAEAAKLIASMGDIDVEMTQNWNRRYRENMLRIKSGDLREVSQVIKGLMLRDGERGLSTGERKMLRSAKQILISEIVLSREGSYEDVEREVDSAMISKQNLDSNRS